MKQLLISCALLIAVLCTTVFSSLWVNQTARDCYIQLGRAQFCAQSGDWDGAARLAESAHTNWQTRSFFLHILLCHSEIDAIDRSFREIFEHLRFRQEQAYCVSNAALMMQLGQLAQTQRFTLENVL